MLRCWSGRALFACCQHHGAEVVEDGDEGTEADVVEDGDEGTDTDAEACGEVDDAEVSDEGPPEEASDEGAAYRRSC